MAILRSNFKLSILTLKWMILILINVEKKTWLILKKIYIFSPYTSEKTGAICGNFFEVAGSGINFFQKTLTDQNSLIVTSKQ